MVPNKEQVYSEFMPSSVKVVQEQSKADLLYAYLKENTDCDVYYPLDEFRKAKDDWCQHTGAGGQHHGGHGGSGGSGE